MFNFNDASILRSSTAGRCSSWDKSGRNTDYWTIPSKQSCVLADIAGPGQITHIWMTQHDHYRECLIKLTFDNAQWPSILCPLGDFFGLGHNIVNSYQSLLFTASTSHNNQFNKGCDLNCYAPIPFRERALVELINDSQKDHCQYFYIDYESLDTFPLSTGYLHAEFRRVNPFGGWGPYEDTEDAINKEMNA